MNFSLTEEHLMIQEAARDFAQTAVTPWCNRKRSINKSFQTNSSKKWAHLVLWELW